MTKVTYIEFSGTEHSVYVEAGWLEKVGPMDELERDMLDFAFDVKENSRLSCQIKVEPSLDERSSSRRFFYGSRLVPPSEGWTSNAIV